jgi:hypothetical protein
MNRRRFCCSLTRCSARPLAGPFSYTTQMEATSSRAMHNQRILRGSGATAQFSESLFKVEPSGAPA